MKLSKFDMGVGIGVIITFIIPLFTNDWELSGAMLAWVLISAGLIKLGHWFVKAPLRNKKQAEKTKSAI